MRLADVQKVVCDVFGVEPAQLRSDRKGRSLSEPRMLAMWLARKYTRAPWSEIGQFFGRHSHSTVISAHRRVEKLIASQAQIGMTDQIVQRRGSDPPAGDGAADGVTTQSLTNGSVCVDSLTLRLVALARSRASVKPVAAASGPAR